MLKRYRQLSGGLAQGPYMAARVEFEPATLQTQSTEPTTEPPRPLISHYIMLNHITLYFCTLPNVLQRTLNSSVV